MKYVDVVVANSNESTDRYYTYECEEDGINVGNLVNVMFARTKKPILGVVVKVYDEKPKEEIKYRQVIDINPEVSLNMEMVSTAVFLRARYLCRYMEALSLFFPSGKPSKRGIRRVPYKGLEKKLKLTRNLKFELNDEQMRAFECIKEDMLDEKGSIFLVQGITGSGKTELYIKSIEFAVEKGKTALVLVPEITLTTQMVLRFAERFGLENIAVLHSRLSLGERYDEWQRIRNGKVRIVIGARSAIFAPLENIGIIVLDEEHEASYKSDKTPKYETVDVAVKRAKYYNAVVMLGSATPSIISKKRAFDGIYKLIKLNKRYNGNKLPTIEVVDMRQELRIGNTHMISSLLYEKISNMLELKKQIILFLNRRGYSTVIVCKDCGIVMKCENCDITLTYHKEDGLAHCHYCGKKVRVPNMCPNCSSDRLQGLGMGTEKVEEQICEMFTKARVERLDLDSARKKGSIEKILDDFNNNKINILIGTQIVAKGLDFKNVGLVGVVLADTGLNIPDFRASEKTFQLITQVVGRAGRGDEEGCAVVQTYQPQNIAITCAAKNDYDGFYKEEIEFRKHMMYPPFCDLLQVIVISDSEGACMKISAQLYEKLIFELKNIEISDVFMPQKLLWSEQKAHYRYGILIKCPKNSRQDCLGVIAKYKFLYNTDKKNKVQIALDVNPY
ncbi:MAG: replication restart helicase PriA [Eubacteriales bacterium]